MSFPMNLLFGDQTGGDSPKVLALRSIDSKKYNQDFTSNLQGLNRATDYMGQYMISMQKGIDDANKNIIQKIQDFIADLIIIFGGGSGTNFDFGDLGYIVQALGALFGFQGLSGPANLVDAAVHFFTNFLGGTSIFGDVINGFIKAVFEFFAGLLSNVPIVGSTLADIVTNLAGGINSTTLTANNAATGVTNVTNSVVTIATTINATTGVPYNESPNPFEDCSFPVSDLIMVPAYTIAASTGTANGAASSTGFTNSGVNHNHTIASVSHNHSSPALTPAFTNPLITMVNQRVYFIAIRSLQNRPYSTIGFITNGGTAMTNFFAKILKVNPSDGSTTLVYDCGDVKGSLIGGSGIFHQRVQLPQDIIVQAQDNNYLAIMANGGTMCQIGAMAIPNVTPPSGVFPAVITGYRDGQATIPATNTAAQITNTLGQKVWGCLGQPTALYDPLAKYSYNDNLNRSDGVGYGASWITSGQPQGISGGKAAINGTSDGVRGALYLNPVNTDTHEVSVIMGSTPANNRICGPIIRARSNFASYAQLRISNAGLEIVSGTALATVTSRVTNGYIPSVGEDIRFKVAGNVFTAFSPTSAFTPLVWTDSGNVVSTGPQCRYTGFGLERGFFNNSATIDEWTGKDS